MSAQKHFTFTPASRRRSATVLESRPPLTQIPTTSPFLIYSWRIGEISISPLAAIAEASLFQKQPLVAGVGVGLSKALSNALSKA
eukprot:CAMPEP_0115118282 /NCGR_PEP_ID=MMETSP0227-20121206/44399_1 /TAXON_ID=89957 /ORGANISM="Polarella glacialis, Strain CCMP 1383" /LENGTH=84 /DNA_ID=CAMNT_0002519523 /DNA_START=14 /DNA_END=264 /DNA_ORIENTATION=+